MSATPQPLKRPANLEEFAAAIRVAADAREQVRLTGSGSMDLTRFDPARPQRQLSTLKLNKVIDHAISDMTITVEAGISLEALQRHLAWHNQWLPVDPPSLGPDRTPGQRTLGGLIASNSLGPLRFGFGDWRLFILGMRWIDAAGRPIKGGGRTMKNVAGYSTPRLMIGSCGSLGAIAQVTLRTFTRPPDEQCLLFYCPDAPRAEQLIAQILLAPTTPAYIQLVGARTFARNPLQLPTLPHNAGMIVAVGYCGLPNICAAQIATLRSLPTAAPLESISQTAAQSGRLRLWMTTEPALPDLPEEASLRFRLPSRSSNLTALLEAIERLPQAWAIAEISGTIRGIIPLSSADALKKIAAPATILATRGLSQHEHAPNPLLQKIKHQIDPAALFGTGPRI